jgi:hypothetical protein
VPLVGGGGRLEPGPRAWTVVHLTKHCIPQLIRLVLGVARRGDTSSASAAGALVVDACDTISLKKYLTTYHGKNDRSECYQHKIVSVGVYVYTRMPDHPSLSYCAASSSNRRCRPRQACEAIIIVVVAWFTKIAAAAIRAPQQQIFPPAALVVPARLAPPEAHRHASGVCVSLFCSGQLQVFQYF